MEALPDKALQVGSIVEGMQERRIPRRALRLQPWAWLLRLVAPAVLLCALSPSAAAPQARLPAVGAGHAGLGAQGAALRWLHRNRHARSKGKPLPGTNVPLNGVVAVPPPVTPARMFVFEPKRRCRDPAGAMHLCSVVGLALLKPNCLPEPAVRRVPRRPSLPTPPDLCTARHFTQSRWAAALPL